MDNFCIFNNLPVDLITEIPLSLHEKGILAATNSELNNILKPFIKPQDGFIHYNKVTIKKIISTHNHVLLKILIQHNNYQIHLELNKIIKYICENKFIDLLEYILKYFKNERLYEYILSSINKYNYYKIIPIIHNHNPEAITEDYLIKVIINEKIHIVKFLINHTGINYDFNPFLYMINKNIKTSMLDFFKNDKPHNFIKNINELLKSDIINISNLNNIDWLYDNYPNKKIIKKIIFNNYKLYVYSKSWINKLIHKYNIPTEYREEMFLFIITNKKINKYTLNILKKVYSPQFKEDIINKALELANEYSIHDMIYNIKVDRALDTNIDNLEELYKNINIIEDSKVIYNPYNHSDITSDSYSDSYSD